MLVSQIVLAVRLPDEDALTVQVQLEDLWSRWEGTARSFADGDPALVVGYWTTEFSGEGSEMKWPSLPTALLSAVCLAEQFRRLPTPRCALAVLEDRAVVGEIARNVWRRPYDFDDSNDPVIGSNSLRVFLSAYAAVDLDQLREVLDEIHDRLRARLDNVTDRKFYRYPVSYSVWYRMVDALDAVLDGPAVRLLTTAAVADPVHSGPTWLCLTRLWSVLQRGGKLTYAVLFPLADILAAQRHHAAAGHPWAILPYLLEAAELANSRADQTLRHEYLDLALSIVQRWHHAPLPNSLLAQLALDSVSAAVKLHAAGRGAAAAGLARAGLGLSRVTPWDADTKQTNAAVASARLASQLFLTILDCQVARPGHVMSEAMTAVEDCAIWLRLHGNFKRDGASAAPLWSGWKLVMPLAIDLLFAAYSEGDSRLQNVRDAVEILGRLMISHEQDAQTVGDSLSLSFFPGQEPRDLGNLVRAAIRERNWAEAEVVAEFLARNGQRLSHFDFRYLLGRVHLGQNRPGDCRALLNSNPLPEGRGWFVMLEVVRILLPRATASADLHDGPALRADISELLDRAAKMAGRVDLSRCERSVELVQACLVTLGQLESQTSPDAIATGSTAPGLDVVLGHLRADSEAARHAQHEFRRLQQISEQIMIPRPAWADVAVELLELTDGLEDSILWNHFGGRGIARTAANQISILGQTALAHGDPGMAATLHDCGRKLCALWEGFDPHETTRLILAGGVHAAHADLARQRLGEPASLDESAELLLTGLEAEFPHVNYLGAEGYLEAHSLCCDVIVALARAGDCPGSEECAVRLARLIPRAAPQEADGGSRKPGSGSKPHLSIYVETLVERAINLTQRLGEVRAAAADSESDDQGQPG